MKIRLVASDMDGTLLDPLSHISEENANAIRELQQSGAEFVICSGRAYSGAHPIVSGAGIQMCIRDSRNPPQPSGGTPG